MISDGLQKAYIRSLRTLPPALPIVTLQSQVHLKGSSARGVLRYFSAEVILGPQLETRYLWDYIGDKVSSLSLAHHRASKNHHFTC